MSEAKPKNVLHMMYDKDGYPTWQTEMSPEENTTRATCIVPPDHVMPVIFVPGIMGSNLKFKTPLENFNGGQDICWRPDDGWYTAITFGGLSPAERRKVLDPENTELDDRGEIPNNVLRTFKNLTPNGQSNWKAEFTRRGWGTVMLSSYGEILCRLEKNLNRIYEHDCEVSNYWQKDIIATGSKDAKKHPWGEMSGYEALSIDDLKEKVGDKYWFPVHAAGYNWLRSNEEAGKALAERIKTIKQYYVDLGMICEKVIVITHSMGGLATRAACHTDMGNIAGKVAGVVHGEQPAIGAAAAYKRMHAGFEADFSFNPLTWLTNIFTARALGWSGKEVTTVLANAQGGLELLPTKRYPKGWLRVIASGRDTMNPLPESNPYSEIYAERDKWWRLINPEWIEPKKGTPQTDRNLDSIWDKYLKRLDLVETFHDKLGDYYHDVTHAHYGADEDHKAWTNFTWRGVWGGDARGGASAELVEDKANGEIVVTNPSYVQQPHIFCSSKPATTSYVISAPDLPGDGTVPECSGADSASKAKFSAKMTGYDHQASYSNKAVQDVTTYSVARIAKEA